MQSVEWPVENGLKYGEIVKSLIVPAHPHPVLCPEKNEGWQKVRDAYDETENRVEESIRPHNNLFNIMAALLATRFRRSKSRMGFGGCNFHDLGSTLFFENR